MGEWRPLRDASATMSTSRVVRVTVPVRIRADPPHTTISTGSEWFSRSRNETDSRARSSWVALSDIDLLSVVVIMNTIN